MSGLSGLSGVSAALGGHYNNNDQRRLNGMVPPGLSLGLNRQRNGHGMNNAAPMSPWPTHVGKLPPPSYTQHQYSYGEQPHILQQPLAPHPSYNGGSGAGSNHPHSKSSSFVSFAVSPNTTSRSNSVSNNNNSFHPLSLSSSSSNSSSHSNSASSSSSNIANLAVANDKNNERFHSELNGSTVTGIHRAPTSLMLGTTAANDIVRAVKAIIPLLSMTDTSVMLVHLPRLKERLTHLSACFSNNVQHSIAVKTNPHPAVLAQLVELGYGLEAASLEEVRLAQEAGCPGSKIVFDSPVKTRAEINLVSECRY